jgi:ATP/maltotriose-dependent transcriptional regulator MalT
VDHWEIAKHVMAWHALPEGYSPRTDRVAGMLHAIAGALRDEDDADVERLAARAVREVPDRFIGTAFLVPKLLRASKRASEAEAAVLECGPQTAVERRAFAVSLLASALAQQARLRASARYAAEAVAALEDVDDEVLTAHVESRIAEAATWRGDVLETMDFAERAARRYERHGLFRLAAGAVSMQLLPHYENGDIAGANAVIDRFETYARLSSNQRWLSLAATLRVLHAAMIADEASLDAWHGPLLGSSGYDRFVLAVYTSLPHAWHGRWHDFLARVETAQPVTVAQRALVDATLALGAAATRDDVKARMLWRRAVHRIAGGATWHLSDVRIRRLVRALACAAGEAVGDVASAQRAAIPLRGTRHEAVFTGEPEPTLAGHQRAVARMREARRATEPSVFLTPAQAFILKTLATDASIAEIARNDPEHRSVATIRSHVQRLYDVLGVHSRTGAVLKAKELALL